MKCVMSCWVMLVVASCAPAVAGAACTDPRAVAATRAAADVLCSCSAATDHRQYVKCVAGVANASVKNGSLSKQCKRAVVKCAAKSTCGTPGFVSCCRTTATGITKCSVKVSASKCAAPKGGAACVGLAASCCDACSAGSCPVATTTTIPGGPTTTTMPAAPQTHTVMVGQDGLTFTPASLTIRVGDTVHWVWATAGHSVVSGTDGTTDNQFCSPDNTRCDNPPLSSAGATYDRTFGMRGAFPYYCSVHFALGMTGTIRVQ